jgi:pyruvate/2-oxoglutarate/acetoin dehydrogenase E1 component
VLLAAAGDGTAVALCQHVPGLEVCMPATPAEAAHLFNHALSQPRPSLLFLQP